MINERLSTVMRQIRKLAAREDAGSLSDAQLLDHFAREKNEAAFEAILKRYASLVWGLCFRLLQHRQDAEDAYQATFLTLARRASSIHKKESLGAWLYGVAYRVASRLKAAARTRHRKEARSKDTQPADPLAELTARELCQALDRELAALPAKDQAPLILCYLEGKTQDEAAGQLGLSLATFKRRLQRARESLRTRLARRGFALSTALLGTVLSQNTATAAISPTLAASTINAAIALAKGKRVAGLVSAQVIALTEAALKVTLGAKLKMAMLILMIGALSSAGAGLVTKFTMTRDQTPNGPPSVVVAVNEERRYQPPAQVAGGLDPKPIKCEGHETFVVSVAVSPDGKVVASGSDDQTLRFWNASDGKALHTVLAADPPVKGGWVGAVAFAPDGKAVVAKTPERGLQFYDPETGKIAPGRTPLKDGAYGVAFSPDGKLLAAANNNWVRVYDAVKGEQLHEFTFDREQVGRAWRVAFTPDSKHVAAALHCFGGRQREGPLVRVWELASRKQVFTAWAGSHANAVAFSPDGKLLAAGGENNGTVEVYDWTAKKLIARFQADVHVVFCLAFSADGKKLYTGGNDPQIKVWDATTGKSLGQLKGHTDQVADLAFSADGTTLASAGRDKLVLIWRMPLQMGRPPDEPAQGEARASPAVPSLESLVGKSEAEVHALLGVPTSRREWQLPQPGFGPKPANLPKGTRFVTLHYADYDGRQWHVMLVAPEVYQQQKGKAPGKESWYVLEVAVYPKGAVF